MSPLFCHHTTLMMNKNSSFSSSHTFVFLQTVQHQVDTLHGAMHQFVQLRRAGLVILETIECVLSVLPGTEPISASVPGVMVVVVSA